MDQIFHEIAKYSKNKNKAFQISESATFLAR